MLTKDFGLEIKALSDEGTLEGYGSVFGGSPDSYGDVVSPGAFAESLVRHKREGTMPLMLFGHNAGEPPIGNWTDIAEDGKGLWMRGQIDLEDGLGQRVHRALRRKAIRGLSIGYEVKAGGQESDPKKPGVNTLKNVELYEVSIVNFPANRRATVIEIKAGVIDLRDRLAAGGRLTEREWERLFKEQFELTNSEAERAVRIHFKGQGEPDGTASSAFLRALLNNPEASQ